MQVQLIKTVNSIFESMAANCMIIKSFDLQFTEFRELFKLKSVLILFKLKINNAFKMKFLGRCKYKTNLNNKLKKQV